MWMVATGCLSRERLPIMSQAENHDHDSPTPLLLEVKKAQSILPSTSASISSEHKFQQRSLSRGASFSKAMPISNRNLSRDPNRRKKNCSTLPGWMLSRMAVSCIFFELGGAQVFEVLNLQSMGDQQNSVPLWYLNCGVYTKHSKELYFCSLGAVDVRLLEEQLPKKGQVTEQIARNLRTNGHTEFHWFQRASRISMKSCIQFQAGWNNPFDQLVQASSSLVAGSFYCKKKWREQQNKPIYHNMRLRKSRINIIQHISALK